jgi:pimeloyl-ACP methyl ester carboxylesterase
MKKLVLTILVSLGLLLCLLVVYRLSTGSTPPIRDTHGQRLPGSIASLEPVSLGGIDQWLLIRGSDTSNPVLLWLHGGPGAAQIPIARAYNGALETHFVVVHWDQRGAGKSNPKTFDESSLTFQQFLEHVHQLTQMLKSRFDQEKIYLVGHSWGTQIGIRLAQSYPQDYHAYIGVSQFINAARTQEIGYRWLEDRVHQNGQLKMIEALAALGEPPYLEHRSYVAYARLIDAYGGNFDVGMAKLGWITLLAPEYSLGDILAWLRGANRGSGPMWDDPAYQAFDAMTEIPTLEVPVYFFSGRQDYNTPLELVERYVENLIAPQGKQLVVFEDSAHTPFLGEPEKLNEEIIRVKGETYPSGSR